MESKISTVISDGVGPRVMVQKDLHPTDGEYNKSKLFEIQKVNSGSGHCNSLDEEWLLMLKRKAG
jgi:hypothetical protein